MSSSSPFCIKLEAFLRMAGLQFETKVALPTAGPRRTVPWIDDDGTVVADSQLAIEHLVKKHDLKLDEKLDDTARVTGHAVRRMLEEATYFGILYLRWIDPAGWEAYKPVIRPLLPPVVGGPIVALVRRGIRDRLNKQGTGRCEAQEINAMLMRDFDAVAELLGDKPFLLGDQPTSHDATVFAMVTALISFPVASAAKNHVDGKALGAYRDRFAARIFG